MAKEKTVFVCSACGYETPRWMGKCLLRLNCPLLGAQGTPLHALAAPDEKNSDAPARVRPFSSIIPI